MLWLQEADNCRIPHLSAATLLQSCLHSWEFSQCSDVFPSLCLAGISGNWKNHFTVTQSEAFDKVYQEKMSRM